MFAIKSLSEVYFETFFDIIDLQTERNKFYSNIYNVIPIQGVGFVPTNVSACALKIPPSQKSRYLGTCVLSVYVGIKHEFIHLVFTQLFTQKFFFFVVGRFLFEQCDHQNQCNGSINANVCKGFGNKTLCYCNHGYLEFEGKCIQGTVTIWYFSRML